MKVLMFGWEYPPHVYGGLATANFGIAEGLHAQPDTDITVLLGQNNQVIFHRISTSIWNITHIENISCCTSVPVNQSIVFKRYIPCPSLPCTLLGFTEK